MRHGPIQPALVGNAARGAAAGAILLGALGGCGGEHVQSVLHPAGIGAETVADLWWFMFAVLGGVFLVTMLLAAIAVLRRPREGAEPPLGGTRFVVVSGIVLPSIILVVLTFASLRTTTALTRAEADLTIRVIGHRWWWEVEYPELGIITANEIHIPVGRMVRFELVAQDVIHSFWVPNLAGKMDMIPDHVNGFWLRADRAGVFRGQCAEYCGLQHALMAFTLEAMPAEEFAAWAERRARPREVPPDPILARGYEVFFQTNTGCHACHAIRGTPAEGRIGPDLTHVGSRLSLGAGTVPNTPENLARWIVDPQVMKPGNRMPATEIAPEDLEALTAYLMSLK